MMLYLLVDCSFAEEYNYYQMGVLPSQFYSALTGKDIGEFRDILWKMGIVIVSVCIVRTANYWAGLCHNVKCVSTVLYLYLGL